MTIPAGIEISPNSRFTVSDVPGLAPGHCVVCGATDSDRKYVDFGLQLEFFGAVYFCTHCFAEAAMAAGFIPVKDLQTFQSELIAPDVHEKVVKEYREFRNAVRVILRDCNCSSVDIADVRPVGDSSANEGESEAADGDEAESEFDGESGSS